MSKCIECGYEFTNKEKVKAGFSLFSELIYKLLGIISFIGIILVTVFSCILIMSNIKFKDK